MDEWFTGNRFDNDYLRRLIEWFKMDAKCSEGMNFVRQILETSDLVLKRDLEFIEEEVRRKKKKLEKEKEEQQQQQEKGISNDNNMSATKDEFVQYSDILEQKKDYIPALYNRDNLYQFAWMALRMKLILGFCPYIVTVDKSAYTVKFEVYEGFQFVTPLDVSSIEHNRITVIPPKPSEGNYMPDITLSVRSNIAKGGLAFSYSNHTPDYFKSKHSNQLPNGQYLFMYVWDRAIPAVQSYVPSGGIQLTPKTAVVDIYHRLEQFRQIETAQQSTILSLSKVDMILTTTPRAPLTTTEIGALAMDQYGQSFTDLREQNRSDVSQLSQRRQQQIRQNQIKTQQDIYYNSMDPSNRRVVTSSTMDNREHFIADGLQVAAQRFPTDNTEPLKISIEQRDSLMRQLSQLITGFGDQTNNQKQTNLNHSKISSELAFLQYSSTIQTHQNSVLELLNDVHMMVRDIMVDDLKIPLDKTLVYEPDARKMTKAKRQRRNILNNTTLDILFSTEFTWQSDSHTKRMLDSSEMLGMVRDGILTKEEMRKKLL